MSETLLLEAKRLHQSGQLGEATRHYHEFLRTNPRHFEALFALGMIYFHGAQFQQAQYLIGEALKLDPLFLDGLCIRGVALVRLQRHQEGLDCLERALSIKPDFLEALSNQATTLLEMNCVDEALIRFERVLALDPNQWTAWNNRGNALVARCRFGEAVTSYERALAIQPKELVIWINRGKALAMLNRQVEALTCFDSALSLNPEAIEAIVGRGTILFGLKRYENAAADFEKALKIDPERKYLRGNLLQCRLYCCDWHSLEVEIKETASAVRLGRCAAIPMAHTMFSHSANDQLHCSQVWIENEFPAAAKSIWSGERYNHKKIRVAYFSPEFTHNPVATQLAGVFERHDKNRFETIAIVFGHDDNTAMRLRVTQAFDRFIDVRDKSDHEVAMLLREMEVDIIVDLAGLTGNCRTGILAFRPAPIQVNYLGFPATMGADYIDYIIADRVIVPVEQQHNYTEKVVYLPHTYMPNDSERRIAQRTPSRTEAGLPDAGFVFCSFNNSFKIMPNVFDIWMELLRAVDGSVLWLAEQNPAPARNLKHEAEKRGVDPQRLVFAAYLTAEEEHLARLRLGDLFLDTLPYNAHATACDALWAGLPVVTCIGGTFAGRVAASVLEAVGLRELVTDSLTAYQGLALHLAHNPAALVAIKTKLARNGKTHPLFDTAHFTLDLEAAYTKIWEHHQQGNAPATFARESVSPLLQNMGNA